MLKKIILLMMIIIIIKLLIMIQMKDCPRLKGIMLMEIILKIKKKI